MMMTRCGSKLQRVSRVATSLLSSSSSSSSSSLLPSVRFFSTPTPTTTPAGTKLKRTLSQSLRQDQDLKGNSGIVATVFGATGFLGTYVVNILGKVGSQVIVPYRGDGQNARHLKMNGEVGGVIPLPFDLKDEESIRRAVKRSNVVINLIGSNHETMHFDFHATNVKIPYRLAQIAKEEGVDRFIHVSHMGANPDSKSSFFRTKYEGEQVVKELFPEATILRPNSIFGRADKFLCRHAEFGSYSWGIPMPSDGSAEIQPVYVHDVANAILNSITYSGAVGKTINLAGPDVFSHKEIIQIVAKGILPAYPRYAVPIPPAVMKLAFKSLKMAPRKLHKYSPDEIDRALESVLYKPIDGQLSFADLGIKPVNLDAKLWDILATYANMAQLAPSQRAMGDPEQETRA